MLMLHSGLDPSYDDSKVLHGMCQPSRPRLAQVPWLERVHILEASFLGVLVLLKLIRQSIDLTVGQGDWTC